MPRRTSLAIALAACAFALGHGTDTTIDVQLTPAGDFLPSDGRELKVPHWHIDQAVASRVIARFNNRKNPAVVDYEHQTLHKEQNGQPAPAAAWITALSWREGQGLFATVELTARARQAINDGEYKFVSPVFSYDSRTGDVLDVQMAALTNYAGIDGMEPLALRAAATFGINPEEPPMNKLLLAVCAALALSAESTTEDAAAAALTAHFKADPLADIRKAIGAGADDKPEALVAACTALKTKADASSADPDPAKFVPVSVLESVKGDLAALTAKVQGADVDVLVKAGLADGRLLKAQEDWARKLGASDIAQLTAYLDSAAPIAALNNSQTKGKQPIVDEANGLNAEQLAVCSATGIDPKDFAAAAKAA
ncbi:phage protease [Rhodanobacter sp. UC4450_H17]